MLRQLGLRLDVVCLALAVGDAATRRAASLCAGIAYGEAAVYNASPVVWYNEHATISPEKLRTAEAALRATEEASGERVMRTLAVRALALGSQGDDRHERLPLEIMSDIARRAGADAPSWHLGIGTMNPPRSTPIVAADARAAARAAARRGI